MNVLRTQATRGPRRGRSAVRAGSLLVALGVTFMPCLDAFAQAIASAPAEARIDEPAPARVAAYLLSPEAEVAGLLLEDGRELHVPPRFGEALASLVAPGQRVRVSTRQREEAARGGLPIDIMSLDNGRSLAEMPTSPEAADRRTPLQALHVGGVVRQRLHGPRGDANGVLLTSGVQVAFPPHVANELGAMLDPGQSLEVDGYGRTSRFGTVVQATTVRAPGQSPLQVYGPASRP